MRQLLLISLTIFLFSCSKEIDDCGNYPGDNCFVEKSILNSLNYGMSKEDVISVIGNPFSEVPSYAHPLLYNHCVWQRYDHIARKRTKNKNIFLIVDFFNDSLINKSISKDE